MIGEFKLLNWRNCERARFVFSARKNVFSGPNGAGKSNLLEALGFLGILRSFRTARIAELVRIGAAEFHLRGDWLDAAGRATRLEVGMDSAGKRRLLLNQAPVTGGRDFIQHFQPVIFAPEDIELATGAPGVRRRFFDMLASQLDTGYMNVLHDYFHALRQRNAVLKSRRRTDIAVLEAYEGLLAFAGADLTARRRRYVECFNAELGNLEPDENARIRVEYRPQCDAGPEAYLELFARSREREIERRTGLVGCHLDDFRVWRGALPMRGVASNGQNRLAALYFKLASTRMMMAGRGAENLVVLADDVTGDLDETRRQAFFRTVENAGQLFFTFTRPPRDDFFAGAATWRLPPD